MPILALLLTFTIPPTPARTPAPRSCVSGAVAPVRRALLEEINAVRRKKSLAPLRLSDPLCRVAQKRADVLTRGGEDAFEALEGDQILAAVARDGYDARYAAELLVQTDGSPREIVAGWRRDLDASESYGRPEVRDLGIGVGSIDLTPVYVFLFALEEGEAFQDRTAGLSSRADVLAQMLDRVNAERRQHLKPTGRAPSVLDLRRNSLLDRAAQAHAEDMLARSFYGHEDPEGRDSWYRARAAGYRAWTVGENIAQGQSSLAEVMKGWMESPEHRKNILNLQFSEAGFGLAVGRNKQGYQVLWVQVFGKPR